MGALEEAVPQFHREREPMGKKGIVLISSAARSGTIWMTLGFADCSTSCVRVAIQ